MSATASTPYNRFSLTVVPQRDQVAVAPVGELDLASVDETAAAVRDLRDAGFDKVTLDLRAVDFIDSVGLRMLIGLREDAEQNGHQLTLVSPKPVVARIFDLTRTRDWFHWEERFPA